MKRIPCLVEQLAAQEGLHYILVIQAYCKKYICWPACSSQVLLLVLCFVKLTKLPILIFQVRSTDPLPKQLCTACINKLNVCHEFAESCIQAENKLLDLNEKKHFRCVDIHCTYRFSAYCCYSNGNCSKRRQYAYSVCCISSMCILHTAKQQTSFCCW